MEDETGDDLQCDHDEGEDQQDRGQCLFDVGKASPAAWIGHC
ncbi:hypothetical protein [Sinorhizobium meliloti]|nr:hypothetical protein [Sinorhizobium meliloti]